MVGQHYRPTLGERLVFDRVETDERTRVNQHVPTSLWEGKHNYLSIELQKVNM